MDNEKRAMTPKDLWSLRFTGDPELSPEGDVLVWVETCIDAPKNTYHSAIHMSRREKDGKFGEPRRLTWGKRQDGQDSSDRTPRFSPDGRYLAFSSNRSGRGQIWLLDIRDGGEAMELTKGEEGPSQFSWSPDSRFLVYSQRDPRPKKELVAGEFDTKKDLTVVSHLRYKANGAPGVVEPRPAHIYTIEIQTGKITKVTDGEWQDSGPTFSPDGKSIAFTSARGPDRELRPIPDLYVVPRTGGEPTKLSSGKGPVFGPKYSPDGNYIAVFGHEQGEVGVVNTEVLVFPAQGGAPLHLWDVDRSVGAGAGSDCRHDAGRSGPYWSADSRNVYFTLSDRGTTGIYATSIDDPRVRLVLGASPSNLHVCRRFPPVISSMSAAMLPDGHVLFAINGNSSTNPADIYVAEVAGDGSDSVLDECILQRVTTVNEAVLSGLQIAEHRRFTFRSKDDLELDGWVLPPANLEPGKKYPAIIQIHGGPHSAYGEAFFQEFHVLAGAGFGLFYCNPRGSSGYGRTFAEGVVGDWGGMDYEDIMACKRYAESIDWVDSSRIGVTGGSYGGYMTNWIVGQTDAFQAAVTVRSISNMYTKYGTSDIGWYGNKKGFGGRDLWDSEDFIMERSPMRYAPNVTTPLLIIHSEQDYRCPLEQAEQWYVALKRLGKTVEFARFQGENHELTRSGKPWNRVEHMNLVVDWFKRYLGSEPK